MNRTLPQILSLLVGLSLLCLSAHVGCNFEASEELQELEPRVQPFLNSPGTRGDNQRNRLPSEFLVQQMDEAKRTLDVCVYGFSKQNVIDAIIRAHDRGVKVRVVGDGRSLQYGSGYDQLLDHEIPLQAGNQFHIMHNKFFIIDNRFVFVGTGNITTTGFGRNNNNWTYIDSVHVAADFRDEFEQMYEGRFSVAKERIDNGNSYQVGDTEVEVYFSPQEDTMGVILEELDAVHTAIHFQIFAFTKDHVASRFLKKHRRFMRENAQAVADGELDEDWQERSPLQWPKKVVGLLDRSQIHGNGQYHQGYRLQAYGVPMRLDANENSRLPGDYQAGGGRLHTKTMILDYGTPDARVVTGSFNWSSAATVSNDEVLLVLRGERVVEAYMRGFREMWHLSRSIDGGMCYYMREPRPTCSSEVDPGDVLFSEIHWDGYNGETDPADHLGAHRSLITNDQFIELYNTTDKAINLSMWTIAGPHDVKMGFTPGTVIGPGEYFLILDHNSVPYVEGEPLRGSHAFINPDFVLNMANDPRFRRLNLHNASMGLMLRDATGELIDVAGDQGPAFWGGRKPVGGQIINHSMERIIGADGSAGDGSKVDSWQSASATGDNVHPDFQNIIRATPGEPNSGG